MKLRSSLPAFPTQAMSPSPCRVMGVQGDIEPMRRALLLPLRDRSCSSIGCRERQGSRQKSVLKVPKNSVGRGKTTV